MEALNLTLTLTPTPTLTLTLTPTLTLPLTLTPTRQGGGWRGFYRGAAASTVRAIVVTCSRLVAYEQVKAVLAS